MQHLSPLAHDEIPEVAYCPLFIIGLTSTSRTRVETEFKKHLGAQITTCLVQMKLLQEAIAVATKTNLDIGVIADVVQSTKLQSLAVMANAATASGSAQNTVQCTNATMNASSLSPLGSLGRGQALSMYGGSSTEQFLRGKRRCFNCRRLLGRDPTK